MVTTRRSGLTPAERKTARGRCVVDGCRARGVDRIVIEATATGADGPAAVYRTPHRVCSDHPGAAVDVAEVARRGEQELIREAAQQDRGWNRDLIVLAARSETMP